MTLFENNSEKVPKLQLSRRYEKEMKNKMQDKGK